MDYTWNADLATLLRINKNHKVLISAKGNDTSTVSWIDAIIKHFANTPVSIKKGTKRYGVTFPLKFVQYDEKTIFSAQQSGKFALSPFLHIFFISSGSVDEYRTSVRHNVSEWFATLANTPDAQWLIVIDTTRSKEKKNRSHLIDKLKSDFSKHQNRLVEVSESVEHGSFSVFVQAVQHALALHYEILTESWERYLRSLKDDRNANWDIVQYANEHLEHARFLWSIGCLEYALKLYDEFDAYLYNIMICTPIDSRPNWMKKLNGCPPSCPKLSETIHLNVIDESYSSFLGLRQILLSQQMLITLCIYQQRLKAQTGVAPSIRVDFAGIILRYAAHCLQMTTEHAIIQDILPDEFKHAVWSIYLIDETFSLCTLLAEPAAVDGTSSATCQLHLQRFKALLLLEKLSKPDQRESRNSFLAWFGKTDSSLSEAIQSPNLMAQQIRRAHDQASAFFTQVGRERWSSALGLIMSQFLNSHDQKDAALPLELKFALDLMKSESSTKLAQKAVSDVLPKLELSKDSELLLTMYSFLCTSAACSLDSFSKFLHFLDMKKNVELRPLPSLRSPFAVKVDKLRAHIYVPGDTITVDVRITSSFAFEIPACSVSVVLTQISQNYLDSMPNPTFQLGYDKEERKSLMTCISLNKNKPVDKDTKKIALTPLGHYAPLASGTTELELRGTVEERGYYVIDKIDIVVASNAAIFEVPRCAIATRDRPFALVVQKTPNKLDVKVPPQLIAGVSQKLLFVLEAGAKNPSATSVTVYAKEEPAPHFLVNNAWSQKFEYLVPPLAKNEKHMVEVMICLVLHGRIVAEDVDIPQKIFVEWQEQVWPIDLRFKPLFTLSSTTTQLEANCLLETELMRPNDITFNVKLVEANTVVQDQHADADDTIFLNHSLPEAPPSAKIGLVWLLGPGADDSLRYLLTLKYTVESADSQDIDERIYVFEDVLEVIAPKVEFELCAQILSHHPGAQLCRAGTACDMVINLRSLTNRFETIFITLEAGEELWQLDERVKVVQVKESGVAQIAFTVMPMTAGFLPFPAVEVFAALTNQMRSGDGFWSDSVEYTIGQSLLTFQRSAGKQIRVLGGIERGSADRESRGSRSALRERIGKFFD